MSADLHWGWFKVGKGWAAAAWTPKGLSGLVLPRADRTATLRELISSLPSVPAETWEEEPNPVPAWIAQECSKAYRGRPFRLPKFDLGFLTSFQQKILLATCSIPRGQYRSYGWVAAKAGYPRGARAAGQALNRCPIDLFIPCHRVIASGNRIGGYGGDGRRKVELLELEGVSIKRGLVN